MHSLMGSFSDHKQLALITMSNANDAIADQIPNEKAQQPVTVSIQEVRKEHRIEQARSVEKLHALEDKYDALEKHAADLETDLAKKDELFLEKEDRFDCQKDKIICLTKTVEELQGKVEKLDGKNIDLTVELKSNESQIEKITELRNTIAIMDKALRDSSDQLTTVTIDRKKLAEQNAILTNNIDTTTASNKTATDVLQVKLDKEISSHQMTKDGLKAMQDASVKQDAENKRIAHDLKIAIRNHNIVKASFQIMKNPDPCAPVDLTMDDCFSSNHLKRKFDAMDELQDSKAGLENECKSGVIV